MGGNGNSGASSPAGVGSSGDLVGFDEVAATQAKEAQVDADEELARTLQEQVRREMLSGNLLTDRCVIM